MRFSLVYFVVIAVGIVCLGSAKKAAPVPIRFYLVADSGDTNTLRLALEIENAPREVFVQKRPILTQTDIVAFYPFAAHDGSLGVYFQLDARGNNVMQNITAVRRRFYLIAAIDRQPICMLLIDRPITDALIVVPNGITEEQRYRLGQQFPLINETQSEGLKRKKEEREHKGQ